MPNNHSIGIKLTPKLKRELEFYAEETRLGVSTLARFSIRMGLSKIKDIEKGLKTMGSTKTLKDFCMVVDNSSLNYVIYPIKDSLEEIESEIRELRNTFKEEQEEKVKQESIIKYKDLKEIF